MTLALTVDGEIVSLGHLDPITRQIELELRGGFLKAVDVEFRFSCHCYSRGLETGESAPVGQEVPDGSKHAPRPRAFDRERYRLSLDLVARIESLIKENGTVTKSRHENFYRIDQVETIRDGETILVSYLVFMHARKVRAPNRPKSILVFVESAYPEQQGIPQPLGRGSRTFAAMLGEIWG